MVKSAASVPRVSSAFHPFAGSLKQTSLNRKVPCTVFGSKTPRNLLLKLQRAYIPFGHIVRGINKRVMETHESSRTMVSSTAGQVMIRSTSWSSPTLLGQGVKLVMVVETLLQRAVKTGFHHHNGRGRWRTTLLVHRHDVIERSYHLTGPFFPHLRHTRTFTHQMSQTIHGWAWDMFDWYEGQ